MTESDREYYSDRVQTERERADRTDDPVIAKVHHKLADLYEERIGINNGDTRPAMRVVA